MSGNTTPEEAATVRVLTDPRLVEIDAEIAALRKKRNALERQLIEYELLDTAAVVANKLMLGRFYPDREADWLIEEASVTEDRKANLNAAIAILWTLPTHAYMLGIARQLIAKLPTAMLDELLLVLRPNYVEKPVATNI